MSQNPEYTLFPTQSEQFRTVDDVRKNESLAQQIEAGECPWCSDYEGEHVGRHASSAHPEKWERYSEDE